jgi:maltose alpha-D-glucosyltransferase/alpha-amylase
MTTRTRPTDPSDESATTAPAALTAPASETAEPGADPLWYKDAVIYEVHVRAFYDSDANGVGDFVGLTDKLDYLQDLGVTTIWLLPFYPSPLKDDGYDIADYTDVNPDYGTLRDARTFIKEAHRRGLRVITELVCNHTSDQHPWFQRARRAPKGSPAREFYVWSDTTDRYADARIIFKDTETSNWSWDAVAGQYYWHRFFSHQPDLNFENPKVQQAVFKAMEFWLDMGVDGLRLDAVPYLYEEEGTNCENLPRTHEFLKQLRAHIDANYRDRMLLAEANQWPEDSVTYFGNGDECNMAFHFPVMPRLYMAIRMEDRFPIVDIMAQTPPIPENAQWAMFLRNHDELTLEMVTDEERDYMYRVYAGDPRARINLGIRRRLAPLLGNNRRRIELMNGLLFSMPGTPVLYYGDEIGMGDNIYLGDRNGVRTPMQWTGDRNAGFSQANGQALYFPVVTDPEYHYQAVNVQVQQANPQSLLWWMKRLIALRKRHPAFGRGTLEFLSPDNRKVLAFIRRTEDETILVVANLSRFTQPAELDLSAFQGRTPWEMFGRVEFPRIGDHPYFLTIGPHAFYWFTLESPPVPDIAPAAGAPGSSKPLPTIRGVEGWDALIRERGATKLSAVLPGWIRPRRWFRSKARDITATTIRDAISVPVGQNVVSLVLADVAYRDGDPETYAIPLAFATGDEAARIQAESPANVVARIVSSGPGRPDGVISDAFVDAGFSESLLELIGSRRRIRARGGELVGTPTREFRELRGPDARLPVTVSKTEQSNSSAIIGDRLILKLFRRLESGINPDLEVTRFLTEQHFPHIAAVAGFAVYRTLDGDPTAAAIAQQFIPNEGDVWALMLDRLDDFVDRAAASEEQAPIAQTSVRDLLARSHEEPPDIARRMIEPFLDTAWLLGVRTAELHRALASDPDNPDFAPQAFSVMDQRSLYQSLRNQARQTFQFVGRLAPRLPVDVQSDARDMLGLEGPVETRFRALLGERLTGRRIRVHGDLHAGQILYTGRDVVIIDFEGEPLRPLSERRRRRSALVDVAGMIRSFHYAAHGLLLDPAAAGSSVMPATEDEFARLLDAFLLEKAIYEVSYELNNRPDWVRIPLRGIRELLAT